MALYGTNMPVLQPPSGGLTPYQLRAQQDSIAEGGGGGGGGGAVWVQPDPDGNGGGFWDTSGAYMGTPGPNGVSYQDWIGNQRPGTGSYQSSKGMFGDIWNSGLGGKIAIGGLAAMTGGALGGYGAAADAAAGAGEAGVGAGVGAGTGADVAAGGGAGVLGGGAGTGAVGAAGAATGGGLFGSGVTAGQALTGAGLANQVLGGGSGGAPAGGSNAGGIVGSLLGGALGGLGGGNRPAGTTTTTTNQTLAPGGMQQLQNTIAGQYLDPATNPYLNQTYDAAARQITPRVNSLFEASGRYGSGAHQGVLGQTLSDLGTSIYGGNYNAERSRQLAAAGTPVGNTVTNPYFTNPLGGALSGALAGGVLGGGTNFLNGGILNGLGGLFNNSSGNTGGTSDQTNNWNPSMPLPDYYGSPSMGTSPANFAYNPNSYAGNNYYGLNSGAPSPTLIDDSSRLRVPL